MHYTNGGSTVHRYQYGYDAMGNRLFARVKQAEFPTGTPHDNDRSYLYGYDDLQRLVSAELGQLSGSNDGMVPGGAAYGRTMSWLLDSLGNWSAGMADNSLTTMTDTDGDTVFDLTTLVHHETGPENAIVEVVTTVGGSSSSDEPYYNLNGNLVIDDAFVYSYDAWNRLIRVHEKDPHTADSWGRVNPQGALVAEFAYDGLGRLMSATADGETVHYFYDGVRRVQEVIEDATTPTTQAEFVYGPDYVDEFVVQTRNDGQGGQQAFFVLQDANYNVVALLDTAGDMLEQYVWEPYGDLYRADESATPDIINRIGHQGLFLYLVTDGSTTLPIYYNRNRWYAPRMGRFLQRDPHASALQVISVLAMNGHAASILLPQFEPDDHFSDGMNLFLFGGGNPANRMDPAGLFSLGGLLATGGAQGLVGGLISGAVTKAMGGAFWKGFAGGALAGGLGGAAGFAANSAFGASFAGLYGTLAARGAIGGIDGAVSGFAQSYYNTGDLGYALADAVWGLGIGAATGGAVHYGSHSFRLFNEWADAIGMGHAWTKHAADWTRLGIKNYGQLTQYIKQVMSGSGKPLSRGRWAWWDSKKSVVVIFDPNNADGGTAFIPQNGKSYFDDLE